MTDQRRELEIVDALRGEEVVAPGALRQSIEELTSQRRRRPRARPVLGLALALGCVLIAFAAALIADHDATFDDVMAVASAAQLGPAPSESRANPQKLNAGVGGVSFPNWEYDAGWSAVASGVDTIDGRRVRTVVYENEDGARITYAILAGSPVAPPAGETVKRGRAEFRLLTRDGRSILTWEKGGRTCVITSTDVSPQGLLALVTNS